MNQANATIASICSAVSHGGSRAAMLAPASGTATSPSRSPYATMRDSRAGDLENGRPPREVFRGDALCPPRLPVADGIARLADQAPESPLVEAEFVPSRANQNAEVAGAHRGYSTHVMGNVGRGGADPSNIRTPHGMVHHDAWEMI